MPHAMAMSAVSLTAWIVLLTMGLFTLGLLVAVSNYRALAALERSERQLSTLVKSTTDYAICMLDRDGRISQWNTGAQNLTGYPADEAIGMRSEEHTSELQSLMRISYAVFCLNKKTHL